MARTQPRPRAQPRKRGGIPHLPIILTVGLVVVVVLVFLGVRWYMTPVTPSPAATAGQSQAAQVMSGLTSISASQLDSVGKGSSTLKMTSVNGSALTGADGKPEVLYVGAEYCPYCAAQRWALAIVLSRFGTFSNVGLTTSSSSDVYPNTPTLTFHGSSYSSQYLDFTPVEIQDRQQNQLDQLSSSQQALMQRYDTGGSIPFIDMSNRYVTVGAAYSPQVLQGMSHAQVVAALQNPSSTQAKAALGTANVMTASLCKLTNEQPANVCTAPIQSLG